MAQIVDEIMQTRAAGHDALNTERVLVQQLVEEEKTREICAQNLIPDILSMIFLEVAQSDFEERGAESDLAHLDVQTADTVSNSDNLNFNPSRGALLVAQICRGWRDVAMSTPRMWAFVHIDLIQREVVSTLEGLQHALQRSAGCALAISVSGGPRYSDGWTMSFDSILALLAEHATRWAQVDLRVIPLPRVKWMLQDPGPSFPSLRNLKVVFAGVFDKMDSSLMDSVTMHSSTHSLHDATVCLPSGIAPMLHTLDIPSVPRDAVTLRNAFSWRQMRSLSVKSLSNSQIQALLPDISNLEVLRCSFAPCNMGVQATVVTLPRLHTLHIDKLAHIPSDLDHLRTPMLRQLHVVGQSQRAPPLHTASSFLERNAAYTISISNSAILHWRRCSCVSNTSPITSAP